MRETQDNWNSAQWAEYYEKLEQKNYMAYQESGESRYDRAQYRYGKIAEAFWAKAREEAKKDDIMKRRSVNHHEAVARLIPGRMYTEAEVRKLLDEAVWW